MHVLVHPVCSVVMYEFCSLWCWGCGFDECCQFMYLSVHAYGKNVCMLYCIYYLFVVCDLNEFKVMFC